jgi:hypothetical protein
MEMFKLLFAAALVSVVSGCVSSDGAGPNHQSMARAARVQQTEQAANPSQPKSARPQMILGAAY